MNNKYTETITINFFSEDCSKITLQFSNLANSSIKLPTSYLQEREQVWEEQKSRLGKNIWNGIVYTIKKIKIFADNEITISLGLCEYKDIVFKKVLGSSYIAQKYGYSCVCKHIAVIIIPKTIDEKYVFGKVGKDGYFKSGQLSLIGGSLNYDEFQIKSIKDINRFAAKELAEEMPLSKTSPDLLKLYSIIGYNNAYHFLFSLDIPMSSEELERMAGSEEISRFLALSKLEIQNYKAPSTNDFDFYRLHIMPFL